MVTENQWGTDGVVSLPQSLPSTDVAMVDFEGFCFTPDGLRINLTSADRESLLLNAFRPGVSHG